MTVLSIIAAIVMLGVIVVVHELGHYCVGRLCRVGIEEFSVGFGKKLFGWRKNGIDYSLRLIFLGGYVRFKGEDGDSDDPSAFNNQPVWKRFLTVAAGPVMNFVLAFAVTMGILMGYGLYETVPVIDSVIENTPAAAAGLQGGDTILAINGTALSHDMEGYALMSSVMSTLSAEDKLVLDIDRGGEKMTVETGLYADADGSVKMGVYIGQEQLPVPLGEALNYSAQIMKNIVSQMLDFLKKLIFKGEGAGDVAGTVGIVSVASQAVRQGFDEVLYIVLIISLNLGIVNLLPLPALDGGRLVFLVIEAVLKLFGRGPIPRDKEGLVHAIGLILLFILFIILTYKDIARLIAG